MWGKGDTLFNALFICSVGFLFISCLARNFAHWESGDSSALVIGVILGNFGKNYPRAFAESALERQAPFRSEIFSMIISLTSLIFAEDMMLHTHTHTHTHKKKSATAVFLIKLTVLKKKFCSVFARLVFTDDLLRL